MLIIEYNQKRAAGEYPAAARPSGGGICQFLAMKSRIVR